MHQSSRLDLPSYCPRIPQSRKPSLKTNSVHHSVHQQESISRFTEESHNHSGIRYPRLPPNRTCSTAIEYERIYPNLRPRHHARAVQILQSTSLEHSSSSSKSNVEGRVPFNEHTIKPAPTSSVFQNQTGSNPTSLFKTQQTGVRQGHRTSHPLCPAIGQSNNRVTMKPERRTEREIDSVVDPFIRSGVRPIVSFTTNREESIRNETLLSYKKTRNFPPTEMPHFANMKKRTESLPDRKRDVLRSQNLQIDVRTRTNERRTGEFSDKCDLTLERTGSYADWDTSDSCSSVRSGSSMSLWSRSYTVVNDRDIEEFDNDMLGQSLGHICHNVHQARLENTTDHSRSVSLTPAPSINYDDLYVQLVDGPEGWILADISSPLRQSLDDNIEMNQFHTTHFDPDLRQENDQSQPAVPKPGVSNQPVPKFPVTELPVPKLLVPKLPVNEPTLSDTAGLMDFLKSMDCIFWTRWIVILLKEMARLGYWFSRICCRWIQSLLFGLNDGLRIYSNVIISSRKNPNSSSSSSSSSELLQSNSRSTIRRWIAICTIVNFITIIVITCRRPIEDRLFLSMALMATNICWILQHTSKSIQLILLQKHLTRDHLLTEACLTPVLHLLPHSTIHLKSPNSNVDMTFRRFPSYYSHPYFNIIESLVIPIADSVCRILVHVAWLLMTICVIRQPIHSISSTIDRWWKLALKLELAVLLGYRAFSLR